MKWSAPRVHADPTYQPVLATYRADEAEQVTRLLETAALDAQAADAVESAAAALVEIVRDKASQGGGIDAFMAEYELSSAEGVVLMCLAEALLRIPDAATIDKLIEDKIGGSNWESHLGESKSWFVNASTWGLMISGRMLRREDLPEANFRATMRRMVRRSGEPFIRSAVRRAMKIMGHQFVMGRSIEEAIKNARSLEKRGYSYSYDMLGEAARTDADAKRYFDDYHHAIVACGEASRDRGPEDAPGVSVKLSALLARYELAHRDRVVAELLPRLTELTRLAAKYDINLTVDAEEADRLDLSLSLFEMASADEELGDWQGLGLAVQAYQKRALDVIEWLAELGRRHGRRIMVRLVKGAYWDTEIKRAQEAGLAGYPVFTRKANTDVSYMACARRILAHDDVFYGQFATHNAHTLAWIRHLVGERTDFEFQRLHGMGEDLYEEIVEKGVRRPRCRIYAPVGAHEDLLAYLVRRLLENGANSSFVNRLVDEDEPIADIVADPVRVVRAQDQVRHHRIPLPHDLYGARRPNAKGLDLSDLRTLTTLSESMDEAAAQTWQAGPLIGGDMAKRARDLLERDQATPVHNPAHIDRVIGHVALANADDVEAALATTAGAADRWAATPAVERAACLRRYADLLEAHIAELIAICTLEAGKNIADGVAEVREAVDFCRYYAVQVEDEFSVNHVLPGPTGERNTWGLYGRGVFVAICPWNFPLAIFSGQVAAALAAGNAVIAKPAEQTCLIGARAVELMHEAGFPGDVLAFLPGAGDIGAKLVADARIAGVAFTGSLATAKKINRTLAERDGPIIPLIAETGGQNAMIVDSSALIEQVVADIIRSGFQSAGQRCSALRVLYVQSDIADSLIEMLSGAMAELSIGDPWHLGTDVTPVIDAEARDNLLAYTTYADHQFERHYVCALSEAHEAGTYVAPRIYELDSIDQLGEEQFGPIVHIIRFDSHEIDRVVDDINRLGYGLTFGIHSRIDTTVERVLKRLKVGNAYVNRNIIGAVVGVHPFGGEGLSGTGPKAGGPHYLHRFATERAVSRDTTAAGGNASLMSLEEDEPDDHAFVTPEPQRLNREAATEPARKSHRD
ncbi:bifunctional proline dehydrogenase/L-glutamate gamma-semialdehyde dehydrogenase PutA [Salinisphaera sp. Q1T1-3]|uniref:bifunctional proline dehydrogenase/L-glutamate gamma-semialdehyde dehydrogenase PutA n=1 Tax=Salinisphaera sp. Q1T1-3 TaxID=2321229 RepID=UPI000E7466D3|nr:bifunctional proline dehydrogenase/L-glutamate gamma-semialdehyde dehydrogenase PutA [Salinisphaera sp. Q1T1-3]RJS91894.1 bifunctional proline dehydrogenase/L-glutamate gamma-semialdehyde dehydrogenase PutA [Salinisphaera sp. Q1T1-3]